jgi:hypothetical protein
MIRQLCEIGQRQPTQSTGVSALDAGVIGW